MTTIAEQTQVAIPANVLKNAMSAALLAASPENYLPVLNAVQITKQSNTVVFRATDRYRLVRVIVTLVDNVPEGDWEVLLTVADCKQIVAAIPKAGLPVARLAMAGGNFEVEIEFGPTFRLTPLDGDFPKTDQIWPPRGALAAVESMGFKPKQLADIAKMPGHSKNEPIHFRFNGPDKAIVSEWTDGVSDYGLLLMPVKFED